MFIDEADIYVKGGDGGNGAVSFRRESHVPRGGPDGGDGGDGGSVILVADPTINTLMDFRGRHHWRAESGGHGKGKQMTGRSGEDLVIRVPVGTVVSDRDSGLVLKDLVEPGQRAVIGRGGKGGYGNIRFANATRQVPEMSTPGTAGVERNLHLELKLIADVGLVGLPNAGKSTLLASLSAATPKIADYPFTTVEPMLGIVEVNESLRFVMADLPGLIAGAHEGVGLGDRFLKHVERTRILLHLVDPMPMDGSDPLENYRTIRQELEEYSSELGERSEIVAVTKLDMPDGETVREMLEAELGKRVSGISAVSRAGLRELVSRIVEELKPPEDTWV